jgi:hypothetical protein
MARRTYTIEELLSFRETGNANGVLAIVGNPELGMFRPYTQSCCLTAFD